MVTPLFPQCYEQCAPVEFLGCQQLLGYQPIGRGSASVYRRPVRVLSGGSGDGWALSSLIGV